MINYSDIFIQNAVKLKQVFDELSVEYEKQPSFIFHKGDACYQIFLFSETPTSDESIVNHIYISIQVRKDIVEDIIMTPSITILLSQKKLEKLTRTEFKHAGAVLGSYSLGNYSDGSELKYRDIIGLIPPPNSTEASALEIVRKKIETAGIPIAQ